MIENFEISRRKKNKQTNKYHTNHTLSFHEMILMLTFKNEIKLYREDECIMRTRRWRKSLHTGQTNGVIMMCVQYILIAVAARIRILTINISSIIFYLIFECGWTLDITESIYIYYLIFVNNFNWIDAIVKLTCVIFYLYWIQKQTI